jgi:hypothetical protein
MSLIKTLHLRTSLLLGSVLGLGFGCIIDIGPGPEPCDTGDHNQIDDGECICDPGYDWCDPNDDTNLDCCFDGVGEDEIDDDNNNDDQTGDGDGDPTTGDGDGDPTDSTDSTGDGDGDGDGDTGTLPPENCTPDEEGFYWCTHSEAMGPEGSQLFVCTGGSWVENAAVMEESCMFDGYDFAYGCIDDGMSVIFECGVGSGEACTEDSPAYCVDEDQIAYCVNGKETWDSCMAFCQEIGIDGVTYEYGECDETEPVACFCCDSGDMGCPI